MSSCFVLVTELCGLQVSVAEAELGRAVNPGPSVTEEPPEEVKEQAGSGGPEFLLSYHWQREPICYDQRA